MGQRRRAIDRETEMRVVAEVEAGRSTLSDMVRELGVSSERVSCILKAHGLRFHGPQHGWKRRDPLKEIRA